MEVKDGKLFLNEELTNEDIGKLNEIIQKDGIDEIIIENDNLSSGIIQLLWCSQKPIKSESDFLNKLFENVVVVK